MYMKYSTIAVIYNPNSTGPSETMARDLIKRLKSRMPKQKVELIATRRAGHAEELAYDIAKSSKNAFVVSSSGDGGYHEVVNGVLRARNEGHMATTGLLPAGNANDHYRSLHQVDIVEQILKGKSQEIDVLKLAGRSKDKPFERYAHSYIGIGLTPKVGRELNKANLNLFNEIIIALKVIFLVGSTKLKVYDEFKYYDSIIFSNISKMSKYLQISQPNSVTDGKLEITAFRRRHKLRLIGVLLKTSLTGLKWDVQVPEFSLETTKKTLFQADGEVITIDANTEVIISIKKHALKCIV